MSDHTQIGEQAKPQRERPLDALKRIQSSETPAETIDFPHEDSWEAKLLVLALALLAAVSAAWVAAWLIPDDTPPKPPPQDTPIVREARSYLMQRGFAYDRIWEGKGDGAGFVCGEDKAGREFIWAGNHAANSIIVNDHAGFAYIWREFGC